MSEPLSEPAPFYQPETDCVLAWHDAAYSQHAWPLPRLLLPHRDPTVRAAVFAAAMLGGKVLPALAGLAGVLVAPAATAARQELQGLPRVGELLAALQREQVGKGLLLVPSCVHIFVFTFVPLRFSDLPSSLQERLMFCVLLVVVYLLVKRDVCGQWQHVSTSTVRSHALVVQILVS